MKLLLHTCCAPCLIYPLEVLTKSGFDITCFFYNPNIHPFSEYIKRKEAVEKLLYNTGVTVIFPEYSPVDFFRCINLNENKPRRCELCWRLRLINTAVFAREKGFDLFSTTLLVSPYQDQGLLKEIGEDVAAAEGTEFHYEDFRPGFKKAHDSAKQEGIYCQGYCGCIYSEIDRYKSKRRN